MSCQKIVIVLACAVCYIAAHPTFLKPKVIDLEKVLNSTVCPIKVVIDEDPERIPRRIKLLKCEENPHEWCSANHIPQHECCAHNSHRHVLECVEIHDKALVRYPKKGITKNYNVSVGCTCLVSKAIDANTISPPI